MTAVLFQLILPLLIAFLFGWLVMGWLTWRWRRTRIARTEWESLVERASRSEVNQEVLEAERDSAAGRVRALRFELADIERARDIARAAAPSSVLSSAICEASTLRSPTSRSISA